MSLSLVSFFHPKRSDGTYSNHQSGSLLGARRSMVLTAIVRDSRTGDLSACTRPRALLEPREPRVWTTAPISPAHHPLSFGGEQSSPSSLPSATICSVLRLGCGALSQDGRAGRSLPEGPCPGMDFSSCDIWRQLVLPAGPCAGCLSDFAG